jgi:hypothetical protein
MIFDAIGGQLKDYSIAFPLQAYNPAHWETIDTNVVSYEVGSSWNVLDLRAGGTLVTSKAQSVNVAAGSIQWSPPSQLATNVTSFAVSPNGSTVYFVSGGALDSYTYNVGWSWGIANSVSTFAPGLPHYELLTA